MESQTQGVVVYVVDDDPSIRATLPLLINELGYESVCFDSAEAFLAGYDPDRPGCLTLDIRLGGMTGLELQMEMKQRAWHTPIVFFTGFGTVDIGIQAMKNGAAYLLEKPVEPQELKRQIAQAVDDDLKARALVSERDHACACLTDLTRREREIALLVAQGKKSTEISTQLGISVKTVHVHRANVMEKCHAANVAQLVALVVRAEGQGASGQSP